MVCVVGNEKHFLKVLRDLKKRRFYYCYHSLERYGREAEWGMRKNAEHWNKW